MVGRCIICGSKPYVYVPAIRNFRCMDCTKRDAVRRRILVEDW